MEASGPDLTGLSVSDDSSDACVSSKAVSGLLYPPPGRGRLGPTRFRSYDSHAVHPPLSVVLGTFIFGQFSLSSRIFPAFSLSSYSSYIKLLHGGHWCSAPSWLILAGLMRFNMLLPASVKELL